MTNSIPDPLNVKAFGAVGDNSADDTAAFQAAIDAAAPLSKAVAIPRGRFKVTGSLALWGGNSVNTFVGANEYLTAGSGANLQSSIRYTGTGPLFVGKVAGTASAPTQTRVNMDRVAAYADNPSAILFDFLNLQWSRIDRCWFRNFGYGIKGKLSLATRIKDSFFINFHVSAVSNRAVTGSAQSVDDSWIEGNYISGSPESNETILIDIYYPNLLTIQRNFIDFGIIGARLESGVSFSFVGNQVDYCPTGLQLKAANGWGVSGNRFTHINKTHSDFWTAPTTEMQNDNWKCIELLLGTKNGVFSANVASGPDRFFVMPESTYSNIQEYGSIASGYDGPIVDMSERTVGEAPDGERLYFSSMEMVDVDELPAAPTASYDGHNVYYNHALVRNMGGVWRDATGTEVT